MAPVGKAKEPKEPKPKKGSAAKAAKPAAGAALDPDAEMAADLAALGAEIDADAEPDALDDDAGAEAGADAEADTEAAGEEADEDAPPRPAKPAAATKAAKGKKGAGAKADKTPQQIEDAAARAAERELARARLYAPRRTDGAAAIGFPTIKRSVHPWAAAAGASCRLTMLVRSVGGPGKGVRIELGGAAVSQGLVEPVKVSVAGKTAKFAPAQTPNGAAFVAELGDVPFEAGIAHPFEPKPPSPEALAVANELIAKTHLEVEVDARVPASAKAGASGLLAVAVAPLAGKTAPMKWTRPFTVG